MKKIIKYIKKDIKTNYCKGEKFYQINIFSSPIDQLDNINIANDIVEKFLKENNINYKKIINDISSSIVGELKDVFAIKYVFTEEEDGK